MSPSSSNHLSISEARKILEEYSCTQTKIAESSAEKQRLREALLLITKESDWENVGVCAENTQQAVTALTSYLKALGYSPNLDSSTIPNEQQPVYIKFNTSKMSCFQDSYTGDYRGVLVSCQSEDDNIAGTYGHLPLNLFL